MSFFVAISFMTLEFLIINTHDTVSFTNSPQLLTKESNHPYMFSLTVFSVLSQTDYNYGMLIIQTTSVKFIVIVMFRGS